MELTDFTTRLSRDRLAAIVRGRSADAALRTVLTLVEEGVGLVEVSLNTEDACSVIARAVREVGRDAFVGAGTVVTPDDLRRARDAGATWVVTPSGGEAVAAAARQGVPVVAGALTPTEAVAVMAAGATAVKLFPASLGGPAYLRALKDPFPDMPLVPVGGVDADLVPEYFAAGAVAVGVGSPLVGDAAHGGDLGRLRDRARLFRSVCRAEGGGA
ncbi:2-dehydro-3-deoxyphosphogluconate aldolase/(4S)-4-hydroxy-2-oxoglutarate aldolase [Streptomyces sp. DSM 42143]|uniref:bifunctional 4-hydroxy-2-oxoglutarate aldolase/2-dehydro-3-deoxy-phosphogluconate aldolase n=1 Tax=Streptomyces TaxID=1883 RepID=UPI0025B0C1AE|nr:MULTISPECIES: bifunctional 4-hydroxy-2-oxoglutarate aldolase/2-dehydro-3-deoxy-phosphogluconate aldolase [unclassified Streptomyces]MDN3243861.1 bifunctional 4-hydroxy-2-oxoglutarate aldolase/2-dehydro-3-deoxy-phosphogluconate aldolase [Streptomyces sp. ZSW22]MDQ0383998.1 2-dehydro-3-deoxyphosphogluconate aldolase/(4S)-4-hydroxy-2-oxoglutarate aldolase [Streptomyces sp. DSM 42143]